VTPDELIAKLDWSKASRPAGEFAAATIRFPARHPTLSRMCPIDAGGGDYTFRDGRLGLTRDDRNLIIDAADISLNVMLDSWHSENPRLAAAPLRLAMRLRMLNIEDPR
jgi:hypothetical protein